ncbi:MAG: ABC transporter permease [Treponema sp.]
MLRGRFDGGKSLFAVWLAVVIFLTVVIIVPLAFTASVIRLSDFARVFTNPRRYRAIVNTAAVCLTSTFLSTLLGYIYAYAVVKNALPFKRFFEAVPVLHLITPPFVGGLAFILLAGRSGFITQRILRLDISLYGFPALAIAQTLCFFPIAYLICRQSLENIDPSLEQAARTIGASGARIFFTLTLPLSSAGIISSALFIAVSVLSDFGNPLIVAGRFRVLAVEIYTELTGWLNAGTSAVLGLVLLLPSLTLFFLNNAFFSKNMMKIATIEGRSSAEGLQKPSLPAQVALTIFCFVLCTAVLAQFFAIIAGSFQKLWGINTAFTLEHIKSLPAQYGALKNSLFFAAAASLSGSVLAALTSFLVYRTSSPLRPFLDFTAQIPAALPGSLMGLAYSLTAAKLGINASGALIAIAMTAAFLPFSYRILSANYAALKTSLDDSARSLGATQLKVFTTVIVPLSSGGFFSALTYSFVRSIGTVSSVIFLISFKTPLASVNILNLAEQGGWGEAAALALVMTAAAFTAVLLGKILLKKLGAEPWKPV